MDAGAAASANAEGDVDICGESALRRRARPMFGAPLVVVLSGLLLSSAAFAQHTYYIAVSGSDSNTATQAQSKTTPWLHAPGMTGCSSNCASYSPVPGDRLILRGGDSWHFSGRATGTVGLPWTWTWTGSSGSPIYVGVDQTWYSGSSWTRPVLNGDNPTSTGNVSSCKYSDSAVNYYFGLGGNLSYVQIDYLEVVGICWDSSSSSSGNFPTAFAGNDNQSYVTWSHIYGHGWTHTTNCTGSGCSTGPAIFAGDSHSNGGQGDQFVGVICDGADTSKDGMSCILWDVYDIHNSVIKNMAQGVVGNNAHTFHDNLITNIQEAPSSTGDHSNGFEFNSEWAGNNTVYNNVIANNTVAVTAWVNPNATDYYYNNVVYNNASQPWDIDSSSGGTMYFYNNTFADAGSGGIGKSGSWKGIMSGNLLINTSINGTPTSQANSVVMTDAQASTAGLTTSNNYAPGNATCSGASLCPVAAGAALTSACSAAGAALCSGTTAACAYSGGSMTCPAVAAVARPSIGAWDVGAFQYSSTVTTPTGPQPPTGVTATVH